MNNYFDLVVEAQKRLEGHAHVTPVMTSQTLNDITGAHIFLKCENFQRMGAFKFRGAFNAMSQLTEEQKKTRRSHLVLRQPCPGRCPGGTSAGNPDGGGHAQQCAGNQA
jgi:threonine dehydratase